MALTFPTSPICEAHYLRSLSVSVGQHKRRAGGLYAHSLTFPSIPSGGEAARLEAISGAP